MVNGAGAGRRPGRSRRDGLTDQDQKRGVTRMRSGWLGRGLWIVMAALLAMSVLAGAAAAQQQITIRIAHADPADPYVAQKHAQALTFKALVESGSGGRIRVEVYPAGQLGGEREYLESVNLGTIEMGVASGAMAGFFPEAMVFDIPYLFSNQAIAWRVLDGPFGQKISQLMEQKTNMVNLAYGEVGFRHFTNNVRPIHSPADMRGLRIRVQETPVYVRLVQSLGGSPTPIPWPEVYSALDQGVVDGQENPVSTIDYARLYEVQRYLTLDGHSYGVDFTVINKRFFYSLSPEDQQLIRQAAFISARVNQGIKALNEALSLDRLQQVMEVHAPTSAELEQFRSLAQQAVIEWLRTQIDPALINEVLEAVREAEASFGN